jgi:hypothetical protein
VTVWPTGYDSNCSGVTLTKSAIANFSLNAKHAAGTALSDKTYSLTRGNVGSCTGTTFTYTFEYNDDAAGYIANPATHSPYFSLGSTTGTLTYKPPPASFLGGLSIMTVNYRLTATFNAWPATTAVQYLTITLNNICMSTLFTSPST